MEDALPLCTDFSVVNGDDYEGRVSMLRCKRWSCEVCNPINRKKVIALASRGGATAMLTLTCDPSKYETPQAAAHDMKRALVLLRRMIERRWSIEKLPFFAVFEKHKSGWPHLHLLIRAKYMHWKVLRGMWHTLTGAYIADIRMLHNPKVAYRYVAKYLGKDLSHFEGCKRWWRSHNYHQGDDDLDDNPFARFGYRKLAANFIRARFHLFMHGYQFEEIRDYCYEYRCRGPSDEKPSVPLRWADLVNSPRWQGH